MTAHDVANIFTLASVFFWCLAGGFFSKAERYGMMTMSFLLAAFNGALVMYDVL